MILKGYDENGELAFKQGPFPNWLDGHHAFAVEKKAAITNGIFCLILENENANRADHRIVDSFAR